MKLNYRGLSYESNSQNIETIPSEVYAKFRGQSYQVYRPLNQASSSVGLTLKFRGASVK